MDHLHEELKQPVVTNDDDDVDANNSNEKTVIKYTRHCITPTVDCDTSEPSDTDYETCDSGLSSESNSVTADISPRADDRDDSLGRKNSVERLTVPDAEQLTSDAADAATESSCAVTTCNDMEVTSPPIVAVGDSIPRDPCDETDCAAAQCRQKSEEGAGEVGTVLAEDPPVAVPPACCDSDTTSLLSTSSDSKCVPGNDAASQTTELATISDTHSPPNRKSSSSSSPRERQPTETADKPTRQLRPTDDTAQKPSKL